MKYLIIGNGVAGIQAVQAIRRFDLDGDIRLIGGEPFPPYRRPMITMMLGGRVSSSEISLRQEDFFSANHVESVVGEWVLQIDVDKREVQTDKKNNYPFDRLLLATGSDPQALDAENTDLQNIHYLRTQTHALGIAESLKGASQVLVIGGGLVGVKAALALLEQGTAVTVVEKLGHPLPLIVDESAGRMIAEKLRRLGIELRLNTHVVSFDGNKSVKKAFLNDGSSVPCDVAIIGIGVQPSLSCLPATLIQTKNGILVDQYMETSTPGIFAAGDAAEPMDIVFKERRINAIWPVAAEQGDVAGMNMAGRRVPYRGSLGRNVLRIGDMDMLAGGMVSPAAEGDYTCLVREDPKREGYTKIVFQGDVPRGIVMINGIEQGGVLLSLIQREMPLLTDKEKLLHPRFNYAHLLPKA